MVLVIIGALLGSVSVAFGAFAEHGLKGGITAEQFHTLMTAIRYNQIHAVIVCAIGLFLCSGRYVSLVYWSGVLFILGTVLFSVSIYLAIWWDIPQMVTVTPLGGVTLIAAWLTLCVAGITMRKKT